MTFTTAYLLVSHGSRDPRPQIALERLSYLVQQQIQAKAIISTSCRSKTAVISPILVETATLELSDIPLRQKIQKVAQNAQQQGIKQLKIIPLFLLPGVHVTEDIPREVEIAQQALKNTIKLQLCPYLGSYKGLIKIIARQFSQQTQDARIIIAHGSRRLGGNHSVEAIANDVNATVAYWSIAPSLQDQVAQFAHQGKRRLTIVPYFLFSGGITTMIAKQVEELQVSFPQLKLNLGHPLGATPDLAALMVEEITQ